MAKVNAAGRAIPVTLINGVTEHQAKTSPFVVYLHKSVGGDYVGMSACMVKRWAEHCEAASSTDHRDHDQAFKRALNNFLFGHYIVGAAKTEKQARDMEAAAIEFYKPQWNSRPEFRSCSNDYQFAPICPTRGTKITLERKAKRKEVNARVDNDRTEVVGEVFTDQGRKRVRVIADQPFEKGLLIECSRSEREKFAPGTHVKVKVSLAHKRGKDYLVAPRTAVLIKA